VRDEKGTTLIEVIAAVTLLAVALLPLMGGITNANNTMIQAGKKSQAVYLAQNEMESQKAALGKAAKITIPPEYREGSAGFVRMAEPYSGYSKKVMMKELFSGSFNLIQVEVTVKWGEQAHQTVNLVTQVTGK